MEQNIEYFNKVKLLILDVDGVLTAGEIIYDNNGNELKIFSVYDGLAISILAKAGIPTILLTGRDSQVIRKRAGDMGVKEVYAGILPKEKVLPEICSKFSLSNEEICFVGDDLIDINIMEKVGVPVAVANAAQEVKEKAVYITKKSGGKGAVREVIEAILRSKNIWEKTVDNFLLFSN